MPACCVCMCVYLWAQPVFEEMEGMRRMAKMRSCLFVVRGCGILLVLCDTWSDVNVLGCVWDRVSWKKQRGRWTDNPVCLMRLNAGIDWSPNHRRKWAWKWMVLCPWLAVELGSWIGGMLAAERHGLNVHETWFHLCLIYSYMILAKWSNKKGRGRTVKGM